MKTAMRAGDKERLATVRLALAAIKQREVDERITLDDPQVLAVLEKMIKQRREAIAQFASGKRTDLVAKETAEISVLQQYLPAQMSEAEVDTLITDAIRRHRRRLHQGHGQGDGSGEGQGPGTHRHGCPERPNKAETRLIFPAATARAPWQASPAWLAHHLQDRSALGTHSAALHRRTHRPRRHRGDHRRARAAEEGGARVQGLLPVPRREDPLLLGQPRQAVLSLLRLRRARHGRSGSSWTTTTWPSPRRWRSWRRASGSRCRTRAAATTPRGARMTPSTT